MPIVPVEIEESHTNEDDTETTTDANLDTYTFYAHGLTVFLKK